MAVVIGIDPGIKGGIAVARRSAGGHVAVQRIRMPVGPDGEVSSHGVFCMVRNALYANIIETAGVPRAPLFLYVEAVGGIRGQSASAAFTFGESTGRAIGAAETAMNCGTARRISKVKWAQKVGLPRGASKSDAVALAIKLFGWTPLPGTRTVSDGEAEAGLIAYAGLLIEEEKARG